MPTADENQAVLEGQELLYEQRVQYFPVERVSDEPNGRLLHRRLQCMKRLLVLRSYWRLRQSN